MHVVETTDTPHTPLSDTICPQDSTAPREVSVAGLWCLVGIGGALWAGLCGLTLGMLF